MSVTDEHGNLTLEQQNALCEPYFATPPPDRDLLVILKNVFQLDSFRPSQLDAIRPVISGRDTFAKMATGSGKSLLWQLPALVQPNKYTLLTVVICPTKSLIMDQMTKLSKLAPTMEAVCYHRDQPSELNDFTLELLDWHNILPHVLIIPPELLAPDGRVQDKLKSIYKAGRLARFVIDEADKFLSWGESFRSAYLGLTTLRTSFRNVPILAMSGSITNTALNDTVNKLGMWKCVQVCESLDRPNLYYEVRPKPKGMETVIRHINYLVSQGPGIVYCTHVKETVDIATRLRLKGILAMTYHTQLSGAERKKTLNSWLSGTIQVIVATTAFGMGIDKSDVRWVIHDTMPSSIEGWFQESGRAGRDGLAAQSFIYFKSEDYYKVKLLIAKSTSYDKLARHLKALHQVTQIILNPISCRRKQLLAYFNEVYMQKDCGACDICNGGSQSFWSVQDVTVDALNALELLSCMRQTKNHPHWTEKALAAAIRGESTKEFCTRGITALKGFGCQLSQAYGKDAKRSEIMEFLLILIYKEVIMEYKLDRLGPGGYVRCHTYIKPGPRAQAVLDGKDSIEIPIRRPAPLGGSGTMDDVKHPVHHVACGVHPDDSNRMIDIIVID